MYARLTTGQIQPGKIDEAVGIYRDSVMPAAKQQRGFGGLQYLVDRNVGKAVVIQFWETEADIEAFVSGSYQAKVVPVLPLLTTPPVAEVYEVAFQA